MKRIFTTLLTLTLAAALLVSCKGSNENSTTTTTTATTTTGTQEVVIPPETVLHSSLYELDLSKNVTVPVKYEDLMLSKAFLEKAVQDDVKNFLSVYGTVVEYEDAEKLAETGDIVELFFTGSAHDPEVKLSESTLASMTNAGDEKGMSVTIGSGKLIGAYENAEKSELNNPGFEDQLIGHKKGDKYVLTVTCPDNYTSEELRGVEVDFAVEIVSVSHIKETELTEELVTKNTAYKSVEEFLTDSEKQLKMHHVYEGLKDVIKVTPHEDKNITDNNMIIEYLFKDLNLVMTQAEYQKRLEAHYNDWYAYYLYYYGISSSQQLEKSMGKDNLILFFQEDMIREKLVEFVTMTD